MKNFHVVSIRHNNLLVLRVDDDILRRHRFPLIIRNAREVHRRLNFDVSGSVRFSRPLAPDKVHNRTLVRFPSINFIRFEIQRLKIYHWLVRERPGWSVVVNFRRFRQRNVRILLVVELVGRFDL